jgi:hypothetical protein
LIPTNDQAHHIAVVAEAKDHLGMVAPDWRGELARYLDFGEEPGGLVCAILDNSLSRAITEDYVPDLAVRARDAFGLISWLVNHAPPGTHGSRMQRMAWQERVSKLVADQFDDEVDVEARDTERPGAPEGQGEAAE